MDTNLRALLTTSGVDAQVIAWLESEVQQCRTMKVFANWVDDRNEPKASVLTMHDGWLLVRACI